MTFGKRQTTCPRCHKRFDIHDNLALKASKRYFFYGFYDAMKQFINYNQVKCPTCMNNFDAPEARLFGIFKSPYTVIAICVFLNIMFLAYVLLFEFNK